MKISEIKVIGDEKSPSRADVYIDGHPIQGVKAIYYKHLAGDTPEMIIDMSGVEIDMHAWNVNIKETAKVMIVREVKDERIH